MRLKWSNLVFGAALLVMIATAPTLRSCEHRAQPQVTTFS
jgi:hypothetical protein